MKKQQKKPKIVKIPKCPKCKKRMRVDFITEQDKKSKEKPKVLKELQNGEIK